MKGAGLLIVSGCCVPFSGPIFGTLFSRKRGAGFFLKRLSVNWRDHEWQVWVTSEWVARRECHSECQLNEWHEESVTQSVHWLTWPRVTWQSVFSYVYLNNYLSLSPPVGLRFAGGLWKLILWQHACRKIVLYAILRPHGCGVTHSVHCK